MSVLSSLVNAPSPAVAVELAANRVSAASAETHGNRTVVSAHATEPLPAGALAPSLTARNLHDRGAVAAALGRVLERIGSPRRVGLIVPDPIGKVSIVKFEQVPARAQDLDQLIRWQVKKTAPFPIEDAQVTYVPGLHAPDGQEFVVTLARRDIIVEFETLCEELGVHAGLVDIATFNVINAALAASQPPGDWLLVNMASDYASMAILRGADLIFFRSRTQTDGTLADLVHQSVMYYEDRLKGSGFSRVLLAGAAAVGAERPGEAGELRRSLEERLATKIDSIDPRSSAMLTDRIGASPALLDTLTPLVGLLVRDREAEA
jgi:hypothetical protein